MQWNTIVLFVCGYVVDSETDVEKEVLFCELCVLGGGGGKGETTLLRIRNWIDELSMDTSRGDKVFFQWIVAYMDIGGLEMEALIEMEEDEDETSSIEHAFP